MASNYWFAQYPSGGNLYLRLFNSAHEVFNFSTNAFGALSSSSDQRLGMTYSSDQKLYRSDSTINWSNVWNKGTPAKFQIQVYNNASPSTSDAQVTETEQITIQFGELGDGVIVCGFDGAFTSTAGLEYRMLSWLERNGQTIPLASGSCTVTVREHGSGSDLFDTTDSAPNAAGIFELTESTPGFTADRAYEVEVAITENAKTWTTTHTLQIVG